MTRKIIGYTLTFILLTVAVFNFMILGTYSWIMIYLMAAILILLAAYGRIRIIFLAVACVGCILGAVYIWLGYIESPKPSVGNVWEVEEAREAISLLVLGAVLFFYTILPGRAYPTPKS